MNSRNCLGFCLAGITLLVTACQTFEQETPKHDAEAAAACSCRNFNPSPQILKRIMAIDPEHVSAQEIREVLAETPAPRIINIHGGLLPIQSSMTSFSEFLVGMGYPRASIRNPRDGSYVFGYYVRSERICGLLAWYYEHEGLRPILVGHSQGGIQVIKVLHELAGESKGRVPVWDPLTWQPEERYDFIDPLTGKSRPVTSLSIPYATAVVAGGLGRALPNQWEMNGKLRTIPDSVEEFTGFQKGMDMLGGDYFGYGAANDYQSSGKAQVRNVRLPTSYSHSTIPSTRHLLKSQQIKDWINDYEPGQGDAEAEFDSSSTHILWAADVWHSIKKHWVLELQRLLTATRSDV
jgi:hypothetical protein